MTINLKWMYRCTSCGGESIYMGVLGTSVWWRCRQCGQGYRTIVEPDNLPALLREQAE